MSGMKHEIQRIEESEYLPQLMQYENAFLAVIEKVGLPTKNIFVGLDEREKVYRNLDSVLSQIGPNKRSESTYITKFLAAVASGLFDAALNYLWDETIQEIRKRVIQYDVEYFYENSTHEEKRKRLKGPDDITKLDDSELIQGSRNIGLISELGYKHLDNIRYMRNWASAAHPNQNQLTGLQLVSWLETCIKEVISLPLSNIVIEIKQLLANIKTNQLSGDDAKQITTFFINLTQNQADNLVLGFAGIYIDPTSSAQTRQNIHLLLPKIWPQVNEDTKYNLGIRYGKYVANNETDKQKLTRQFLERVDGISYIPDDLKATEIDSIISSLLTAHRNTNNFYTEPSFARELRRLVEQAGTIPKQIRRRFVYCITEVFISNGNGIAWNAEPHYRAIIKLFGQEEAIIALLSFRSPVIASRLQFRLCRNQYRLFLSLLRGKISSPAAIELLEAIDKFSGPLEHLKDDTEIRQKAEAMIKILS